jgi:hypothetical protein
MTDIEKDRFYELIFYQYFNNREPEQLQNPKFWKTINTLCEAYDIDPVQVSKCIRILSNPDDKPTDVEMYYILSKAKLSVRKINRISGLYWQRQVQLSDKIALDGAPAIRRRVTDIIAKNSLKEFVHALYDVFGVLCDVDIRSF